MRRVATSPDRVDWFAVLAGLQHQGLPTTLVAEQIRVPKSTILGWKQGAEPKHLDGEKLIELWIQVLGRGRTDVPKVGPIGAW